MSVSENQPTNLNYLSQLGFRFSIKKLPNVNYFCQKASLPSISLDAIEFQTPFGNIPRAGNKLKYSTIPISFRVDEDFKNYIEIHDWMVGLGHPEDFSQTRNLSNNTLAPVRRMGSAASFVSDGTLNIQTSNRNPSINIFFYDMFPTDLTELVFDTTASDIDYIEATVTFSYRRYVIERVA